MDATVGHPCGSSAAEPGAVPSAGCRHAAALVATGTEMLGVAVPYLEQGRRDDDLIVLACPAETADLLRREAGGAAGPLRVEAAPTEWGLRPPDLFARLRAYAEKASSSGSGRLRMLTQRTLPPDPEARREHLRSEAVLNRVLAAVPLTVLCLYDTRRVPADAVDGARRTHPWLITPTGWTGNPDYRSPANVVRSLPPPREALQAGPPLLAVDDAAGLPDLRHRLGRALERAVPDAELREGLHLALSEVAANAFRHGTRPVSAALWADRTRIVCTITDSGQGFDDPLAGFVPARGHDLSRGGMGLWLARKLWDHVDLLPGPAGFTVRLSAALD